MRAPAPALSRAPALTLPEAEAAFLRAGYAAATTILEYGSGGSTAMAAAMPGKAIWSVESDKGWLDGLADWFAANPPASPVHLHHGDIGPTGKWGRPEGGKNWAQYHHYPLSIWDLPGFVHPDTVLIDGRFRAACLLAVLFRISKPVTVYFDDYVERPAYHAVERYGAPAQIAGRMARFDLTPTPVPPQDLSWIMDMFARPQ